MVEGRQCLENAILVCFAFQEQNFTDAFEKWVASKLMDKNNIAHWNVSGFEENKI